MDPGEVPDDLQNLTEIEEMLIARVFPMMLVYRLRGGQHGYRGNVINFPQNVQELATKLPRHPSSLDVLVIRRHSASNPEAFRDFRVCRNKVIRALNWLKENNRYYADIIIDYEVLRSLPIDGSIDDQLRDVRMIAEELNHENEDNVITRTFVPFLPSTLHEDVAIKNALDRMQSENNPIAWPQINSSPINEFQTPGYIACAFSTLYPTGCADLRAE
ncbi:2644_t:CDS:1, partial [Rhizophagus irregularis]